MKKLLGLTACISVLNLLWIGMAALYGRALPLEVVGFVIDRRNIACGEQVKLFNIAVMDTRSSLMCNLTGMDGHAIFAGWSPDGTRTAVQAGGSVYLADAQMNPVATFDHAFNPSWSSSGTLVFESFGDSNSDVVTVDANGGSVRNITSSPMDDTWPSWSYDGTQVVFLCGQEICVANADGQNLRRMATNSVPYFPPRWSYNGQDILFDQRGKTYLIDSEGQTMQPFSSRYPMTRPPIYAPDGRYAAFYSSLPSGGQGVVILDTASGEERRIVANPSVLAIDGRIAWSPDGSRLAFDLGGIYVAHRDSGEVELLCTGCDYPAWLPQFTLLS